MSKVITFVYNKQDGTPEKQYVVHVQDQGLSGDLLKGVDLNEVQVKSFRKDRVTSSVLTLLDQSDHMLSNIKFLSRPDLYKELGYGPEFHEVLDCVGMGSLEALVEKKLHKKAHEYNGKYFLYGNPSATFRLIAGPNGSEEFLMQVTPEKVYYYSVKDLDNPLTESEFTKKVLSSK